MMVLGARAAMGYVLGRGAGAADTLPAWATAGGAPRPIACYQPKGATSLAASYSNLANPGTYDATQVVVPGWNSDGWIANGTGYLSVALTINSSSSIIVRAVSTGANTTGICGWYGGVGSVELEIRRNTSVNQLYHSIGNVGTNRYSATGDLSVSGDVIALTPSGVYRNGALINAWTPSWTNGTASSLALMARRRNDLNSYDQILNNTTVIGVAIYSSNVASYVSAISSALAAV